MPPSSMHCRDNHLPQAFCRQSYLPFNAPVDQPIAMQHLSRHNQALGDFSDLLALINVIAGADRLPGGAFASAGLAA